MSTIARRSFIAGLVSFVAAPAIVRAGSLMPVKVDRFLSNEEIINRALEHIQRSINPPLYGMSPCMQVLTWLQEHDGMIRRTFVLPEEYLVRS